MKKRIAFVVLAFQILVLAQPAFADRIVLKNGDRISGTIIKKDGEKITIRTESAGTIEIKWEAVEVIEAEDVLHIELADGSKVSGTVEVDDEGLKVVGENEEAVQVSQEQIAVIRNADQQAAYEAEIVSKQDKSLFSHWGGNADVGFSLTTGNSKTTSLTFGTKGERVTESDKISLYARGVQAKNSTTGVSVTTAQAFWFGGRYDRNLNKKTFVFGKADFEYDKPQLLNLRTVLGGGFGYKWIDTDRTKLQVFGGATFNREWFENADNRSSAEALIGEELEFKFSDRTVLEQRLEVYPSLTRSGTVRARFDASFVTALNSWLGWHVTLGDRFNSDPVPGRVQNDLLLSTGLRATFGTKKGK